MHYYFIKSYPTARTLGFLALTSYVSENSMLCQGESTKGDDK